MSSGATSGGAAEGGFVTTHWTRVIATRGASPEARQALSDLCAAYYAPVVAFLGRQGYDGDLAREVAHEFFARVLAGPAFDRADPTRGRFRSYLLGALKHHLATRRERERRLKRGGGVTLETLAPETESAPGGAIAATGAPASDAVFDREWAVQVIARGLETLGQEADRAGSRREFEQFKPWLGGDGADRDLPGVARSLHVTEGAARVAIHRWRRRFREVVRSEIARTVDGPEEVAAELRHLIAALSQ